MKTAVTGSDGFIGTAVVRNLVASGTEVVELDLSSGFDVLDADIARRIDGCCSVIHLAGLLGTDELFAVPYRAVDVNIKGTLRVLDACAKTGVSYVGITVPDVWANVYQATKMCCRRLATAWHENFGVGVSHVRAFNVFGPGQKVLGVRKVVPTFSVHAWRGEPLPVFGDGTQKVDLIHVDDVAKILIAATGITDDRVIDAGTGSGTSVLALASMIIEITGGRSAVEFLPMRKGERPAAVIANGDGWEHLDGRPIFRPTDLSETVRWYESRR